MELTLVLSLIAGSLIYNPISGQHQLTISFCDKYLNRNTVEEVLLIVDSDTSMFSNGENNTFIHSMDFIESVSLSEMVDEFCILLIRDTEAQYQVAIQVKDITCGSTVICIENKVFKEQKVKSDYRTCRGSYMAGFSVKEKVQNRTVIRNSER